MCPVWPDSDDLGEKYIAKAAAAIRAEDPKADIRVVWPLGLPNGGKGKDVCDWAGDAEALARLAAEALPYEAREPFIREEQLKEEQAPTPYVWRDPTTLPRRQWLYGDHYARKFVSATLAPGGLGKSSIVSRVLSPQRLGKRERNAGKLRRSRGKKNAGTLQASGRPRVSANRYFCTAPMRTAPSALI